MRCRPHRCCCRTRPRPTRRALVLAMALGLSGWGPVACEEPGPGPGADAAPDATSWPDAGPDGGRTDAGWDGGTAAPRDAGPLPCTDPAWFSPHVGRIDTIALSEGGHPGYGLDVDRNPITCAPAGNCSGGIDNQGGSVNVTGCGSQPMTPSGLNYLIDLLLSDSDPPEVWLVELRDLVLNGQDSAAPFTVVFQHGVWLPSAACPTIAEVRLGTERCDYLADDELFHWGTCAPLTALDNAGLANGVITAGGDGYTLRMVYRAFGFTAGIALHRARLQADVAWDGDRLVVTRAVLGGVMCPRDLMDMGAGLLHVDPELCGMAEKMPQPDLEAGCDPATDPDALSAAFVLTTTPGHIAGLLQH